MTSPVRPRGQSEWTGPVAVARALGISRHTVDNVAAGLGIRRRELPGYRGPLYNRLDLEAAVKRLEEQEAAQLRLADDVHQADAQTPDDTAGRTGRLLKRDRMTARTATP